MLKGFSLAFSSLNLFALATLYLALPMAQAAPIAPKSGAALCALTPLDFQSVGIANASPAKPNLSDGGASAYCVYAGKSAATGGIELDVFYPAGSNPAEVKATQETALGESGSPMLLTQLAGADEARWSPNAVSGGPPFATILVRRGNLIFILGIPAGKTAQDQLFKLAALVIQRF